MEPSNKKRATESPSGSIASMDSGQAPVKLSEQRRKQIMRSINFVEHLPDEPEPVFVSETGEVYDDDEDLINQEIGEPYKEMVTDPDGNRIIIKDIFVENFKSYKGRHQLGPLHKNLTMIVGPNGSGKSNVIDALLFVFGFRAKKIRTSKLTSLIFNNDEDCEHALVEIQFQEIKDIDNEKYQVNIPNTFNIARSIHKNGASQYFLNGNATSAKNIQDILTKAGIDMSHNRFLILQGEVEAIAQMKPTSKNLNEEGMLEYIEDIVGTNRFCAIIRKLIHRCKLLEYNVSFRATQCKRHQEMAEEFRTVLNGAIAYINARNNLTMINGMLAKHGYDASTVSLVGAEVNTADRKKELDVVTKKWEDVKIETRQANEEKRHVAREIAKLDAEKMDHNNWINDWHQTDRTLKNNCKSTLQQFKQCVQEIESIKAELESLDVAPDTFQARLTNMNLELQQLIDDRNKCDKVYSANLAKYDQKVTIEREKLANLNIEVDEMSQHYNVQQEAVLEAENELKEMRLTDANDLKTADEMRQELTLLETQIVNLKNGAKNIKKELKGFEEAASNAEKVRNDVKTKYDEAVMKLAKLKDEKNAYNAMDVEVSYHKRATHALEKLHAEGGFPGFIGRIGDLAWCNKKYDAAISTCFAGSLDWHIVNTPDDCSFAINFLKQQKLPRSTFCPLDYLAETPNTTRQREKSKEHFPATRLYDCLNIETDIAKKAFYKILGDVLIVETSAEAIRLDRKARGKFRYTTYEGTYIDYSGSLSGGGKPSTGRIRTNKKKPVSWATQQVEIERVNGEIERVQQEIADYETRFAEAATLQGENFDYARRYTQRQVDMQHEIEKHENQAQLLRNLIPGAEERKRRVTRVITDNDRVEKQREVEELRTNFEELCEQLELKKTERDRVEKNVGSMFDNMVGVNKEKLRDTVDKIKQLESDIAKERVNFDNVPQARDALRRKLEELERVLEDKKADHDRAVNADPAERQARLQNLMNGAEKIRQELESKHKELDELTDALRALAEEYKSAEDQFKTNEGLYQDSLDAQQKIEETQIKCAAVMRNIDSEWARPETLDPSATFVSVYDPKMNEKIDNKEVYVMPEEVTEGIHTHYQQMYEDAPVKFLANHKVLELEHAKKNLERNTEQFRIKHDEKGITDFAKLVTLQLNELELYNSAAARLRAHRHRLAELRSARYNEFNQALVFLSTTTQLLYGLITNGGDASLKFVEEGRSDDPFVGGIKFSVRPAKKSWKLIENLSGGEKTLASLCFVFAMHHYRPTPLYVMDEIDAALDLNNVRLIATYIKNSERTRNAQFIIISLRNQMFEVGNRLVGIYKTDGCTKNIIINPQMIEQHVSRPRQILEDKLKEMKKALEKDHRRPSEEEDERLTREMSQVHIAPRVQRRLGRFSLGQFGLARTPQPETPVPGSPVPETVPETPAPGSPVPEMCDPETSDHSEVPSDEEFYDSDDEREIRKKSKTKVSEEFDKEDGGTSSDDQSAPPPSNAPSTSDGRRRGAAAAAAVDKSAVDKSSDNKYARPAPTLEYVSDKRRRKN